MLYSYVITTEYTRRRDQVKNGEIKIDKGVEIPRKGLAGKYPFAKMKKGDSFLLPNGEAGRLSVASASTYFAKTRGCKFSIRKCVDGVRCFRIE